MPFNFYGQSDKGKVRPFNDDVFGGFIHKDVLFLMLADSVGTQEGADAASAVALHEMNTFISKHLETDNVEHLKKTIQQGMFWTNRVILAYRRANEQVYGGAATALTVCAVTKNKDIVVGHVGNTRLYLLRLNTPLTQMTKDHTEAQALLEQGKITKEEVRIHPGRGVLTRAIGAYDDPQPDIFSGKLQQSDILVLLTDGIYNLLTDSEIEKIIIEAGESKRACEWLIEGMNQRGGIDNGAAVISYINI